MKGKTVIEQSFSVPFKNLHFHYGGVTCRKLIKELKRTVAITIINYDIREEFDAVKDYFANALDLAHVHITVRIEAEEGITRKVEAQSPQIEGINQGIIETVRFHLVKDAMKKKVKIETTQSMLTMEEFFETFTEKKLEASAFYADDKELAEDLLKISETKHYQHLRYLSGRHAHHIMRLRFVLKPLSFLFLLEGQDNYHIVWETLDTEEATYLWPVDKELNQLKRSLKKIEEILHLVKAQGKSAYISATEEAYRRVFHHYKDGVKGFIKWKSEVESCLV